MEEFVTTNHQGRHNKTVYRYGKVKMMAYTVYFQTRRGGRLTEHRLGLFCPGRGFQPGPAARDMRRRGPEAGSLCSWWRRGRVELLAHPPWRKHSVTFPKPWHNLRALWTLPKRKSDQDLNDQSNPPATNLPLVLIDSTNLAPCVRKILTSGPTEELLLRPSWSFCLTP